MPLEREIKLRFASSEDARARILAAGATPLRARRLQRDALLDTSDQSLYHQHSALRVRNDAGMCFLTFKGPAQPGEMKLRAEHETVVLDETVLLTILESLGFHIWFRYEKFREEFVAGDVVIAIDETPVGVFVELEGGETSIHDTARKLGCRTDDYITDSYRMLFLKHRDAHGGTGSDMLFSEPSGA
jgi:adenylate cyclase class 2